MLEAAKGSQGWYRCMNIGPKGPNHKANIRLADVTIEHLDSVCGHWETTGRFGTQEERNNWYDSPEHLAVFCESCNKARSGQDTGCTYNREVGPDFRGPNE